MITIIDEQFRHVSNPAVCPTQLQNEVVIATVQEFLVTVQTESGMNGFFDEQGLMDDIANSAESQYVIIEHSLLSAVDFPALTIHINNVSEQSIPLRVRCEGV